MHIYTQIYTHMNHFVEQHVFAVQNFAGIFSQKSVVWSLYIKSLFSQLTFENFYLRTSPQDLPILSRYSAHLFFCFLNLDEKHFLHRTSPLDWSQHPIHFHFICSLSVSLGPVTMFCHDTLPTFFFVLLNGGDLLLTTHLERTFHSIPLHLLVDLFVLLILPLVLQLAIPRGSMRESLERHSRVHP